jgi:hypothetical protein
VQLQEFSHSAKLNNPLVVVRKLRTSCCTGVDTQRTQATTTSLCTSRPAQRGYNTSMGSSSWFVTQRRAEPSSSKSTNRAPERQALVATIRGARRVRGPTIKRALGTKEQPTSFPTPPKILTHRTYDNLHSVPISFSPRGRAAPRWKTINESRLAP